MNSARQSSVPMWFSDGGVGTLEVESPVVSDRPIKLRDATSALEREIIQSSLLRNRHNLSRTALELGLSRRGLRLKLAQLGIVKGIQ